MIGLRLLAVRFALFGSSSRYTYRSCHPDSYVKFREYPEFRRLLRSFIKDNRANNCGDLSRLWSFILNANQVISEGVSGDFAELGVWRGNTASVLAFYAAKNSRRVFLFDTFEGFDGRDLKGVDSDKVRLFTDTSIGAVMRTLGSSAHACTIVPGYFPQSITNECGEARYSIVSLDCDLYEPMKEGLRFFYPRMSLGGIFFLHDYSSSHWAGAKRAIDDFCREVGEHLVLLPDKSGSAFMRKSH